MAISYTYQTPPLPGGMNFIVRAGDGVGNDFIPLDLGNRDYQEFLAWMAEGNPAPTGWTGPTNSSG